MKYTVSVRWWLFYPYQSLLIFFARLMNVEPDWQKVGDFFTEILHQSGEDKMREVNRETLLEKISELELCKAWNTISINGEFNLEVYKMLLATMDAEPVAEVVSIYGDPEAFGEREIKPLVGIQQIPYGTKLYRHAQPAPVVPDDVFNWAWEQHLAGVMCGDNNKHAALSFLNTCRAAMLNQK